MEQGNEILNLPDNDEAIVRELEKQINTNSHLSDGIVLDDEAIAKELQEQIDWDMNQYLKRLDRLQNGTSKLNISYEKYQKYDNYDDYGEEEFDQQDNVDWDRFDAVDRTFNSIPPCGYLFTNNGDVVTKHDIRLTGQRNMKRLMCLPPNVQTGDGAVDRMEISNRVLNGLKQHSQNEMHHENMRRKVKKSGINKRKLHMSKKVYLQGVGQNTNNTVNSLFRGKMPYLREVSFKIGEGKESVLYYGHPVLRSEAPYFECILKIYKLDIYEFKLHEKYIMGDCRYKDRYNPNMNKHKIISLWAEKERDNLIHLKRHNIPCPQVITLKNNVLVMTLIGNYRMPATRLKYANITAEEYQSAYKQIVQNMTKMYKNAMLVHADLSENNILWHYGVCYFLDVSQAVERGHFAAFTYLKRDCINITEFFKKKLKKIMTKEELFKRITGQNFNDKDDNELSRVSFVKKMKAFWEVSKNKTANI